MTTQRTNPFPQELWDIIFECVNALHGFNEYRVDPAPRLSYHRWIRGIRTLSTGFNKSVRRYFWESMGTDKMIPLQKLLLGSNPLHKTMIDSIHMYTRYLAIDSPLDLDQPNLRSALQLIAGCKVLEYFSWEYPNIVYTITASVRNDLAASRDEFDRLSCIVSKCCHDFVNQGVALKSYDFEFQSSTERLVMRRRFAKPKHPISSNNSGTSTSKALDKVKVTKEGRRESPQLHLGPRGTEFPRTRKLKLVNCSWGRLEEVPMTWDFKNVRCLSIKNIDLRFFLEGVSLPDLSQLQTFKARQTIVCHSVDPANRRLLEGLIKCCQHLQNLKIECQHFMELMPWDVIRLFGSRLRQLTLLDCFTDQFPRLFYMKSILQNCPNIEDLGIGFFVHTQERDQSRLVGELSILGAVQRERMNTGVAMEPKPWLSFSRQTGKTISSADVSCRLPTLQTSHAGHRLSA
ncbi:hypothetical protein BKA61DRAFT_565967 [Leptodontidium sp. MPI-SDFR-AT-0119]|nr:hypothetical protein BKA61DRAFT_565967 [Leptodontidium sp. MPI-SDFR-AT-0119]